MRGFSFSDIVPANMGEKVILTLRVGKRNLHGVLSGPDEKGIKPDYAKDTVIAKVAGGYLYRLPGGGSTFVKKNEARINADLAERH